MSQLSAISRKILATLLLWTAVCGLWIFVAQRDARENLHELQSALKTLRMFDPTVPDKTRFEFTLEEPPELTFVLRGISATDQLLLASQEKVGFTVSTWISEKDWELHLQDPSAALRLPALGFKTRNATYLAPPREVSERLSVDRAAALFIALTAGVTGAWLLRRRKDASTEAPPLDVFTRNLAQSPRATLLVLGALALTPLSFCLPREAFFPVWLVGLALAGALPWLPAFRKAPLLIELQGQLAQASEKAEQYRQNRITPPKETEGRAQANDRALRAVELLLTQKVDLNLRNAQGLTPLLISLRAQSERAVRLLLEKGADPNAAGPEGRTPLHEAAKLGSYPLCEALLRAGANPLAQDSKKETALQEAERLQPPNRTLVSYLESQIRAAGLKAEQHRP